MSKVGKKIVVDFPKEFDLAVMVDCGTDNLLGISDQDLVFKEQLARGMKLAIIDHHPDTEVIKQADIVINQPEAVATGQLIYQIVVDLNWPLDKIIADCLAISILADSLNLTAQQLVNNPKPFQVMAELVKIGVNLSDINDRKLSCGKIAKEVLFLKGQLLQKIDFIADGKIATIAIETEEIELYRKKYNTFSALDDVRFVRGVRLSLGFKKYQEVDQSITRITVRIRCYGQKTPVADQLATHFKGGGHPWAAGIKFEGDDLDFAKIKQEVCQRAISLLDQNP